MAEVKVGQTWRFGNQKYEIVKVTAKQVKCKVQNGRFPWEDTIPRLYFMSNFELVKEAE